MTPPVLSRSLCKSEEEAGLFSLSERVLQFGAGIFIRSFVDTFIDRANRQGAFDGRVVVVQSTSGMRSKLLQAQDGLYSVRLQGLRGGEKFEKTTRCAAISRALPANEAWLEIRNSAANPALQVIVSNTTEVGLQFDASDQLDDAPPKSFPGKLTQLLYHRFKTLGPNIEHGLVVLPCELLVDNAKVLRKMILQFVELWQLETAFVNWLSEACFFCSTLVDRIVTGTPPPEEYAKLQAELGYQDALLTIAEPYGLWAIEGNAEVAQRLSFLTANPEVIVASNIEPYRELKLRLLNGGHSISVLLAYLAGQDHVLEMMNNPESSAFVEHVLRDEIGPTLRMDNKFVNDYIDRVLERFRNPFLRHKLLDISRQSTMKLKMRVVPSLLRYYDQFGTVPKLMAKGFAGFLLFMRPAVVDENKMSGKRGEERYPIEDEQALVFADAWQDVDVTDSQAARKLVRNVLGNMDLWGTDLTGLDGFADEVQSALLRLLPAH